MIRAKYNKQDFYMQYRLLINEIKTVKFINNTLCKADRATNKGALMPGVCDKYVGR